MSKSRVLRLGVLGTAAAIVVLSASPGAHAYETRFGEVQLVFDTTVSMGASIRTADRETAFLPEGNGGPIDPRADGVVVIDVLTPTFSGNLGQNTYTLNPDNYDGSANTDDGRLNFDNGDWIGATIKANHDLQLTWQNYKVFARAVGFYDVVLNDHRVGERSLLTDDALGDVGRNYELLDLFVSADYNVFDLPVNLRLGKQVINWGESTFILHGNNVFNPIDVGAFRRPGSEIKEALLPVNAVSGSVQLPFSVSLAGYYALDFEPFELDPSGTPFSTADVVALGSGIGGNEDRVSLLSSNPTTGMRRNCDAPLLSGTRTVQLLGLVNDPQVASAGQLDCTDDDAFTGIFANTIDYTELYTIGQSERTRLGLANLLASEGASRETFGLIDHGGEAEQLVDDDGQYGISARYFAEWLGGTEFGFYFQNYHSRLPFISERVGGPGTLSVAVTPGSSQATSGGVGSRTLLPSGCGYGTVPPVSPVVAGVVANMALTQTNTAFGDATAGTPNGVGLDDTLIDDPQDLINPTTAATLAVLSGGQLVLTPSASGSLDTVMNAMKINCMLAFYQSTNLIFGLDTPTLVNGAETLFLNPDIDLLIEYPEDIQVLGFSFNTTIGTWGVQGDFTFRPEAPFQIDTDSLTIAAAWKNCAFQVSTAAASVDPSGLPPLRTPDGSGVQPQCIAAGLAGVAAGQSPYLQGFRMEEMYTAQIGTTATFAASEAWIEFMGADLGILVTEIGMVFVPGVEDAYLVTDGVSDTNTPAELASRRIPVFQNTGCQGSELPLGGLLGLDFKRPPQCRPTDVSSGAVVLFRLDYNNAFDTGFVISPQIAYAYDFFGSTPAPYGNYLEDRQSVNLGVQGVLNNNLRLALSYTNFWGGHINNRAKDQDFASITASYSF